MNKQQKSISEKVDSIREDLIDLSHNIHKNPETSFNEYKTVGIIIEFLKNHGFDVQEKYCGMDTSFKAVKKGKTNGPKISFLAEYDALRGIGHGCGHNVIATCAVGAFIGLSELVKDYAGEISIIGTPAEEGGAGKVLLLDKGGFDNTEYALMMHPSGGGNNLVGRGGRAASSVSVTFKGKAAHSAVPSEGINALSAAISVFNQIDMVRPTFQIQDNINGIILEGGVASNIIPELSVCEFSIRAETMLRLKELIVLVKECIARAESLTRAQAEINTEPIYAERYANMPMCEAFKNNMAELGVEMFYPNPTALYGSSDIGNVSIKIPAIHDYLSITDDKSIKSHSAEYTAAAAMPQADEVCIKGAKGLAMTGLNILESEEFRNVINEFHLRQVPKEYRLL
ncbi:MAG: M20 family metallopeptidase [Sedimentibacter sp.]